MNKVPLFLFFLLFALLVNPVHGDYRFEWHVDATLQERYETNIFLSPSNEEDDFITTFSPGGQVLLGWKTAAINFDYHLNPEFYAYNSDLNYIGHLANLNAYKTLWRHLTFRLENRFLVTRELREARLRQGEVYIRDVGGPRGDVTDPTAFLVDTEFERTGYMRNTLTPSVEWQYGDDDLLRLAYTNERLINEEDSSIPDENNDYYSLALEHWFGPGYGVLFDFALRRNRVEIVSDYDSPTAAVTFTKRFSPRTSCSFVGGYSRHWFEEEDTPDYQTYRSAFTVDHAFSRLVSGRGGARYYLRDFKEGDSDDSASGEFGLTARWKHLEAFGSIRGGYVRTVEFPVLSGFWEADVGLRYQATRRINLSAGASYDAYYFPVRWREDFAADAGMSVTILEWLNTSFDFAHRQRSRAGISEFRNNRISLRLTARY